MAVLAAAQLLDELMGRNRNVAPNEKVKELNWEDPEYCKYFMVKFCPHDLFVNTRADLGACSKVHDEEIRKMFQQAKPHRKIHYQEEFIRFCSSMINEVERKIQKGKMRLALSGKTELPSISPAQSQKNQEQIKILNERINGLEAEAEQAGTDGNVEQAQGLMKLCDQLKEERDSLRKQIENGHWNATAELAAAQEKQMEVCQVCGAFLIVGDAQQRIDDHLMGKQHVGFARLKSALEEITAVVQTAKEERRSGRSLAGRESERERERDREKRRERSEHRSEKDKEKDRRDKDKERKERREREAHRTKEREKERERDRKHRSDRDSGRRSHHQYRR
ncbi:luc7-like protein 3 [Tribolium castaneum]|uniref:Luc7-like protein 3 n=1 Tax=Tribolium castaneum TaxID=7070 RepID=D6WUU0_TRICA|nr:PREDICTED: luc7-like protein 3 [Tribolium castaneum]XP_015838494.1 PREDICTED: luc7-like protein 3 [Tribolium castaneum]EFA09064.2 Luc7-like protein 3 [Tribolium castaneum]|eukprot:XP_008197436.1 PREDICTED: luc7-like protein 3 [Tribolium castaneum]